MGEHGVFLQLCGPKAVSLSSMATGWLTGRGSSLPWEHSWLTNDPMKSALAVESPSLHPGRWLRTCMFMWDTNWHTQREQHSHVSYSNAQTLYTNNTTCTTILHVVYIYTPHPSISLSLPQLIYQQPGLSVYYEYSVPLQTTPTPEADPPSDILPLGECIHQRA